MESYTPLHCKRGVPCSMAGLSAALKIDGMQKQLAIARKISGMFHKINTWSIQNKDEAIYFFKNEMWTNDHSSGWTNDLIYITNNKKSKYMRDLDASPYNPTYMCMSVQFPQSLQLCSHMRYIKRFPQRCFP